ncbi:MAG: hypothetical protein KJP04_04460 [Arenicella sp.]|nr:hypothetical protein [Arenicella sp.]
MLFAALLSQSAYANSATTQQLESVTTGSHKFTVSSFQVEGPNPIPTERVDEILATYLDRPLDLQELLKAAIDIESEFARKGHNFYLVEVPPQVLQDGNVRLEVHPINIADVTVVGNRYFSADNIRRSLPALKFGASPNTRQVANAISLAEANPAKNIKVVFLRGVKPKTVDANISVTDKNPNEFTMWGNNAGSRQTKSSRLGLQYHHRNMWDRDHQVSLSYTTSPEEPKELQQYGINYRFPIFSTRGMANAFYSSSDADSGRVADVFDVSGAGETFGVGYTHFLEKRGDYQHRIAVSVVDKLFDSDVLFDGTNLGEDVRSRPLKVEYTSRLEGTQWLLSSALSHSSNLSGGSLNDDFNYAQVQAGADSDWDKQNLSLRLDYRAGLAWVASTKLFAQSTSDPLITGEKFGMGGALGTPGPRGFYEREVTVDKGVKGTFEVTRSFPKSRIRASVFYDFANGEPVNPQPGEAADESLSSIGLSLDWNMRPDMSLNLDYGYVLNGIDQTFRPEATDDGDSRLHMTLRWFPNWPWGNN